MNAREKKKALKKRIEKLESDNKLMKDIIEDHPGMLELYNLYNRPVPVTYHTVNFEKYACRRMIPRYMADISEYEEHIKHALVLDLAEDIKHEVAFKYVEVMGEKGIEASIFIGKGLNDEISP